MPRFPSANRVSKSLFDANTILKADTNDTPASLTIAEQQLVGRITDGSITNLTIAEVKTLLGAAAASGLATLDASSLLVQSLNASKISAGDIATARMSTNVIAAMNSGDPKFTGVTFDGTDAVKRDVNNSFLRLLGSNGVAHGAGIELIGGEEGSVPGDMYLIIGNKDVGVTPASEFVIKYQADGAIGSIFKIDASGNITTLARADTTDGVRIGAAQDANHIDDASHGAATATLYIGNKAITVAAFTATHYYQLGDLDLKVGELVKLIDRKIYRCTTKNDKAAIGIFWGITDWKDSFETKLLVGKEIDEEYEDENDLEEIRSGVSMNPKTGKFMRPKKKMRKKITNDLIRISDGLPAEKTDYAYSVAALGDSYAEHDKQPLNGAWVTVKAGTLEEGDYLCSSDKSGYMEKQPDAILHNYTRGIAREKIPKDTKTAYVYLV